MRKKHRLRWTIITVAAILMLGWLLLPKVPLLDGVDFSRVVRDREGRLLRVTLTKDEKYRIFTPLEEVSPRLVTAALRHEDRWFENHSGVNPVSSVRALWNVIRGQARGGASTITMQVARLRYRLHTKSVAGKLHQMFLALAIERHYSKAQILEAYFNLAPYGGNIEGVGAAAEIYLQKTPKKVTWPEAVAISLIPQSPERRRPLAGRENSALVAAQGRLFERLLADGVIPDTLGRGFILQAPRAGRWQAPHFARSVLDRTSGTVRTTLDLNIQKVLEERLSKFITAHREQGIRNGAAMLIDARTMDVLAAVGSADFSDVSIQGQVDGTRCARSPGSALKPVLYALALDQGLIHPQSLLVDAPRRYAGYNPENFDREFEGPISAAEALARSRNVPAVDLAARVTRPTFYEFLDEAGVHLPYDEKHYGLSIALGGEEVTMEDVVRLYAMLANGGVMRPLRKVSEDHSPPTRLLSTEASFLTLDMLTGIPLPGRPDAATRTVAWKTGTSHGFRDAWAVAVCGSHVLAVWIGNFDGTANHAFVGRMAAAPLLFQMLDSLRERGVVRPQPFRPGAGMNVRRLPLCAVSGQLPNAHCPHQREGWFIPGVSPISACTVHREALIDPATGMRVAVDDGTRVLRREVFEFWPTEQLALFEKAGLPRRLPPPFLPGSAIVDLGREGRPPRIVSPSANQDYAIRPDETPRLALQAETESDVARLHWFAGSRYLGSTKPRDPLLWKPEPGDWEILAMDDHGRSSRRWLSVQVTAR
jgi:penicillin-binding protein 1C